MNTTHLAIQRASSHRTATALSRLRQQRLVLSMALAFGSLPFCGGALAASGGVAATTTPVGGVVVGGVGSITQNGVNTVVNQQSALLALNWQSFNLGQDASVLFNQPSHSAIALNRIFDQNPSQIFGHINSNGQVFLINTHGIIFGSSAQLNVGGLVASTLDLTPDDFLSRHFNLDAHGGSAGIVNHGTIQAASGGSVSLVGGQVENDGLIVANLGSINLDGADRAVLDFDGDGLVGVQVTGALQQRLNADEAAVANKGTLQADGGTVVLQASAAKDLFTNLVNNSGVIDAHGISTDGGVVRLVGTGGNTVDSGSIDASGVHGGTIQVLSDHDVQITAGVLDASGTYGGGEVLVGGDEHGANPLVLDAAHTEIGSGVTIDASARLAGDGGKVIVWSDLGTQYLGHIASRGGDDAGNGGFVEVSGKDFLLFQGTADRLAPHGVAGTLLLDPTDLTISATGPSTATCSSGTCGSNSNTSVLTTTALQAALAGGSVNVNASAGTGGGTGSINWTDGSVNAGGHSLTLTATTSITFDGTLTNLAGLTFSGTSLGGTGSASGTGAITGIGGATFALSGTKAGTADGISFSGFTAADATTITGATGFDYATMSSDGMAFANATSVTGTGAITNLGSTTFALTGSTAGTVGSTSFSGFTSADTTTLTGAAGFDDTARTSEGMTFANATNVTGSGTIANVTGSFADDTKTSSASSIVYSGFDAVTGTGGSVTGVTGSFNLGTKVSAASGIDYSGFGVTTLAGSGSGATIAGSGQTYTLDDSVADKGSSGGVSWTSFGNITDATGTVNFGTGGSVTGNVTAATLNYGSYGSAVTFALADGVGATTGIGGTWTGVTTVTGNGSNSNTLTGSGQTYALDNSVADKGSSGGVSWTSFGNIDDTTGTVNFGTGGSVTGSVTVATLNYGSYGSAVTFALADGVGATTGIGGTWTGVTTVTGNGSNSNTLTGSGQTYALDDSVADKGSSGGVSWTSFGNIDDTTGTVNFGTGGSVTGSVTAATLNYGSYGSAVTFALADGVGATTGIGSTWTGVTTVTGNGSNSALTGSTTFALSGTQAGSAGGIGFSGFTSADATTVTGAPSFDVSTKVSDGMTFGSVTSVAGSSASATLTGSGQTYTLDDSVADKGSSGGVSWTSFGNIDDTTGTVNFGTGGSVTGNVTAATLNYGSYGSAVTFALADGVGATTGIGGTWTGVTTVTGNGSNSNTLTGSGQTYALDNSVA
ncbi:filamentous hemagglutinin N-terminal domain-containing protein, partial [Rhodanobacter sp. DHB23]|uniref:beta strand repeat-containing protein n=1 Tax=Rhodanobacter sp. DHB23 TaxID=2775923 RepID=UPI00177CB281